MSNTKNINKKKVKNTTKPKFRVKPPKFRPKPNNTVKSRPRFHKTNRASGPPVAYAYTTGRSKGKGLLLSKREFIQDVGTTSNNAKKVKWPDGTFPTVISLAINAGLAVVFPWLSRAAKQFEQYVFKKLKFEYIPSVPTSTKGASAMTMCYNVEAPLPQSKTAMLDRDGCKRGPIYQKLDLHVDLKEFNRQFKSHAIRDGPLIEEDDLRLHDGGRLDFVLTDTDVVNEPTSYGELWVDYEVELDQAKQSNSYDGTSVLAVYGTTRINPTAGLTVFTGNNFVQDLALEDWNRGFRFVFEAPGAHVLTSTFLMRCETSSYSPALFSCNYSSGSLMVYAAELVTRYYDVPFSFYSLVSITCAIMAGEATTLTNPCYVDFSIYPSSHVVPTSVMYSMKAERANVSAERYTETVNYITWYNVNSEKSRALSPSRVLSKEPAFSKSTSRL